MGAARRHPGWLTLGDPLRGLAAFGVLLFHVATWAVLSGRDAGDPDALGRAGPILFNLDIGVFLFFLLSGFLIARPFASAFVLRTPFPRVGRYVIRRALRLAPGLVAATVLAVVLLGRKFESGTVHFWTLGAEAIFYAALPLAVGLALPVARRVGGPPTRAALWVAATSALSVASLWFRNRGAPADFGHQHLFPSVAFAFAPGVALAGVEPLLAPALRASPVAARRAARVLLVLGALLALAYFQTGRSHFMQHSVLAVAACAAVMGAALAREWAELPAWRLLDNRPLQWLGQRSYSLYLFHLAVVTFLARELGAGGAAGHRPLLLGVIAVPISLVLAWAGYALVERPFMRTPRQPLRDVRTVQVRTAS